MKSEEGYTRIYKDICKVIQASLEDSLETRRLKIRISMVMESLYQANQKKWSEESYTRIYKDICKVIQASLEDSMEIMKLKIRISVIMESFCEAYKRMKLGAYKKIKQRKESCERDLIAMLCYACTPVDLAMKGKVGVKKMYSMNELAFIFKTQEKYRRN